MDKLSKVRRQQLALVAVIFGLVVIVAYSFSQSPNHASKRRQKVGHTGNNADIDRHKPACVASFKSLMGMIQYQDSPISEDCLESISQIMELEYHEGALDTPQEMDKMVEGWLGNEKSLIEQFHHQSLIHVYNKLTQTTTIFNPLRAQRPLPKAEVEPLDYLQALVQDTKEGCNFCAYRSLTASDSFGRFESNRAATAANAFKVNDFHALIIPKTHSPLDMTFAHYSDSFELASHWFEAVHEADLSHDYPTLTYDMLPHGGASQVHPHLQAVLASNHYLGQFRALHESLAGQGESEYFSTYIQAHFDLGLAVSVGDAVILAPMDSHKDHELIVLANTPNTDWVRAYYTVVQTYLHDLNLICWSSAMAWPTISSSSALSSEKRAKFRHKSPGLPAFARIGGRGNCQALMSDSSSFELYMFYNVNTDPYYTISAVRKRLRTSEHIKEIGSV